MDFSQLLLEFLKKTGNVSVPSFGEFYLKKTNAFLAQDGQNILPPGKEVAFRNDVAGNGEAFINFFSSEKNISHLEAEIEIKKQVNFWNSKLAKEGKFTIENIGSFFQEGGKITFKGEKTEGVSADFYGLEKINISEIKNKKSTLNNKDEKNSYPFSKSVYWVIPLVIGVLALTYFGITQPDEIFGRKSFKDDLKVKPVAKIKKDSLVKDSTAINSKLDSLKTDSLQSSMITKKTPVKKWSSKKYSKSKWKKAKRHQNR
jgi:nucleoid DNA-binding protein